MWKETEHRYTGGSGCIWIYKAIPSAVLRLSTTQVCTARCKEIPDNPITQYLPSPTLQSRDQGTNFRKNDFASYKF